MANERRMHFNFQSGSITDNPLLTASTTINSTDFQNFPAITSSQYAAIILDPLEAFGLPEIVWVTAHTAVASSLTVLRHQEGSTARDHPNGTVWAHGITATDVDYARNPTSRLFVRANYR
jgi:hypothetical protein